VAGHDLGVGVDVELAVVWLLWHGAQYRTAGPAHVMRIVVIAVGRLRPPYADDVQHYKKLLAGHARVELVEVKDDSQIAGRVPKRCFTVLLAAGGRQFESEAFARFLEDRRQSGMDLCFVIGGPRGSTHEEADLELSLGAMTLPHQLARVVLLEQIYRGHKILAGEPYHY
jgi:23S rRNA (pseudouridine1915-N3)-methyltransferase